MSRYTGLSPYMDPNVFRSSSHAHHNMSKYMLSPRQATTDLSRSLRRDECLSEYLDRQDRQYADFYSTNSYGSDRRHHDHFTSSGRDIDDLVGRTNHNAIMTNNTIERVSNTTLIQPRVGLDGRYPPEFETPMTIAHLMALSESQLDRLIEDYEIPTRGLAGYDTRDCDCDSTMETESRLSKLSALLEFLGARRIADALRSGSGGGMSGSRPLLIGNRR